MKRILLLIITTIAVNLNAAEVEALQPSIEDEGRSYFTGEQFSNSAYYKGYFDEGTKGEKTYIGRRKCLKKQFKALEDNESLRGSVLYPERKDDKWTEEKNMAFMAGVIEARKIVHLVTPINLVSATGGSIVFKKELIWLIENGYYFCQGDNMLYPPRNHTDSVIQKLSDEEAEIQFKRVILLQY